MSVSHPDPRELTLPLRDLVRGLRQKTSGPRSLLAPALEFLPGPLRDAIRDITHSDFAGGSGSRSARKPELARVTRTAAALRGADVSALDTVAAATFAIRILLDNAGKQDLLISKTILALCWHDAESRRLRAASYLRALVDREPFGVAPGLLQTDADLDARERLRICVAVVLWLLSDHNDDGIAEDELVKIAGWLADDCLEACQAHRDDADQLEKVLLETAGRI
ncbi:hypothetical protein [Hoeflea ulvae]|uniref:Uncharacterized protein n=1 Tax=Hoeflea ulvae TaxID=2983764 RepID=A0ABT3YEG6_9HYPH|nr:hypothetical protein [Hoeflea ulvae]MCY0094248.1 hypothetical protein [Hoeflea ulvae]